MLPSPRLHAWLPLAGLTLTILIWSSNNIVGKLILRETSPMMVALVRFTLAGLLFYLPVFLALHRGEERFTRSEWRRLALLGTSGTLGSLVFYMTGLQSTPATDAAIYQLTMPLFVVVIAWAWLGERLSRGRMLGLAVAMVGAVVLVTGGRMGGLGGDPAGVLFIMMSNLTWASYTILIKEPLARRSPLLVLAATNLTAAVAIWPLAAVTGLLQELPTVANWSTNAWLIMLYLVAFMSTSSQWLYLRCLREVAASQASAFTNLQPFFTAILAAIFLGESPTPLTIGAGMLILLGVWLVNRPQKARRRATLPTAPLPSGVSRSGSR